MSDIRTVKAKNLYEATAAQNPFWPTWEELDERSREAYRRKSDHLHTLGPCEQFMTQVVEPWAVPTLNLITRKIDKLNDRKKR